MKVGEIEMFIFGVSTVCLWQGNVQLNNIFGKEQMLNSYYCLPRQK